MSMLSQIQDAERQRINTHNSLTQYWPDRENEDPNGQWDNSLGMATRQPLGPLTGTPNQTWNFNHSVAGPLTPCPSQETVLGRRARSPPPSGESEVTEWSRPNKVLLQEFAAEKAAEYGVPEDKRKEFLEASSLSTHKLLIVTLASILGGEEETIEDKMKVFLSSSSFKENVVGHIRSVLLDPRLSSYKTGFLGRLLRHIRLNPNTYRIPLHLRGAITSRAFASAVGTEATTARSEIKRKLQEGHGKKSDIVVLGRNLAWNNTQEMTDEFWGRMAWLQFFLVDYKAKTSSTRGFWDSVDHDLAERREKAMEHPAETRAALSSVVFEESLKAHINANPLKKKGKPKAGKQMPEWQKVIARSVEEMDKYTLEELAGEEPDLDHENDENQLDPVSSLRSASTGPN
ncbi:hypothetical protein K438DRAFT_1749798 [Mycena galopus ATCC 62051]|nr:hypothetical protein K438DRAFT_1749798 [Mycena galopus ATCC 62051]